jgi:hypothetical protein
MAKTRKLVVEVLADASRLGKTFGQIANQTDSLGKQFQRFGRNVGLGLGAAAGAAGVFAVTSLKAAEEAEQVQKRVAQVIRATGGAANVTAAEINKFAETQQYLVGVDDEVLKKSYGILLTFKNVRNETGKGNDIFNRTAKSLADLAAAGFGSTDSAAKFMGKALQDPIANLGKLSKAGVDFTQAQKDQIKNFVETGDLLSAQKIILGEVESQVGGVAAAGTTASETLSLMFQDLQENIGAALLPIFQRLVKFLSKKVIPAVKELAEKYGPKLREAFEKIRARLEPFVRMLGEKLVGAFRKVAEFARENKETVVAFIAALAGAAAIAGIVALGAAIAGLFNPISLIIVGVAALVAGIVYAYNHFEGFRNVVQSVIEYFKAAWPDVQKVIETVFGVIRGLFDLYVGYIKWVWSTFGDDLLKIVTGVFNVLKGIFDFFLGLFSGNWGRMLDGLVTAVRGIGGILAGAFGAAFELVKIVVVGAIQGIWWAIKGVLNLIIGGWESLINQFVKGANLLIRGINAIPGPQADIPPLGRVDLPRLAKGGIVTGPTIAMIGEAGPEAIVPLSRGGGFGANVTINVQASPLSSPADVGAAVVDALQAWSRRNGRLPTGLVA